MSSPGAHCKATPWFAAALIVISLACLSTAGRAGQARIEEDAGPGHVVLEADEATLDQLLELLGALFEFAVKHVDRPCGSRCISGRLQGSLDQLLQRILRRDG